MRKRILSSILFILAVAFLLSACARSTDAADLYLNDLDGNQTRLGFYKGKVIILNFFATWCPPCRKEIPDFINLQMKYKDRGFTMIGVSLSKMSDVRGFAENIGINYPVLIDDGYASAVYGPIRSVPTTFVIDRDFKVVKKYIGYRSKETFEADIIELIKQAPSQGE